MRPDKAERGYADARCWRYLERRQLARREARAALAAPLERFPKLLNTDLESLEWRVPSWAERPSPEVRLTRREERWSYRS